MNIRDTGTVGGEFFTLGQIQAELSKPWPYTQHTDIVMTSVFSFNLIKEAIFPKMSKYFVKIDILNKAMQY